MLGDASVAGTITSARIVGAIDGGPASDAVAYARADQRVTLYAVIEVGTGNHRTTYSDAAKLQLHGRAVTTTPLARAPAFAIAWHKIEPADKSYTNTDDTGFHFTAIDYRPTALTGGVGAIAADVRPTLTPDHGHGVGTMRYQIVVTQGPAVIASPGPEARRGKGSGGVTDAVMRVSIRRDDSYLGFLTEMYGQPYIWASAGITDPYHQSEHLEGSDCADFMVYGARRMGGKIAYTWTGGLPTITRLLGAGVRDPADGIYRDAHGKPVPFTRAGDLVLFPRHVGALAVDQGTLGVLDDHDIIMHTLFDSPKEEPIADTGYADKPIEVRRFK